MRRIARLVWLCWSHASTSVSAAPQVFGFFDCTTQSDGLSTLDPDPSLLCGDSWWMEWRWIMGLSVLVYVVRRAPHAVCEHTAESVSDGHKPGRVVALCAHSLGSPSPFASFWACPQAPHSST